MKKVLEEEIAAKNNYATTVGIRVGESAGAKTSFWPVALESTEKTDTNEIRSTAEGIWEATGWECPVDKNSVYALYQLHELYVDGIRRRADDGAEPSKIPESLNSGGTGKEKTIPAFKLASDTTQRTDPNKDGFLERTVAEWGSDGPRSPDTPHRNKTLRARRVRIGPDGASAYTAVTGGMKKEYRNVENKLQSASIIKEDEEIVGIIEEVFNRSTLQQLEELAEIQAMETG
jgi:hypothetical protein